VLGYQNEKPKALSVNFCIPATLIPVAGVVCPESEGFTLIGVVVTGGSATSFCFNEKYPITTTATIKNPITIFLFIV
jgi:hypothetical protein